MKFPVRQLRQLAEYHRRAANLWPDGSNMRRRHLANIAALDAAIMAYEDACVKMLGQRAHIRALQRSRVVAVALNEAEG